MKKQTQSDIAIKTNLIVKAPKPLKTNIMNCINSIISPKGSFLTKFDPETEV